MGWSAEIWDWRIGKYLFCPLSILNVMGEICGYQPILQDKHIRTHTLKRLSLAFTHYSITQGPSPASALWLPLRQKMISDVCCSLTVCQNGDCPPLSGSCHQSSKNLYLWVALESQMLGLCCPLLHVTSRLRAMAGCVGGSYTSTIGPTFLGWGSWHAT